MKNSNPKTLLFDIETMPNLVRTWRKWEQNVIWYERYGYLWSISYKYLGEKKVYHKNITDFPLYKKDKFSDEALTKFIWELIDSVDIVIAHNGNAFDLKTITGRFIHYKLPPPKPYQKIDTKILYKNILNEDSNSLKDICEKHNLPHKLETGGEILWEKCEHGDKCAIKKMKEYNNQDVISLEAAYLLILPYITNHPNHSILLGKTVCPKCGSDKLHSRGQVRTLSSIFNRFQCVSCGGWGRYRVSEKNQNTVVST